ncbi:hypothetical protein NB689_003410 [Xanthomonas sacchari]|nr:hypothetical protein [Xanthomonas sacchari]MCW0425933.1 hypothetical protein [Xanthomonas sacchari]
MDRRTPQRRSCCSMCRACSTSRISALSVSSRVSRGAARPCRARQPLTNAGSPGSLRSSADRFTARPRSRPWPRHCACRRIASSSTNWVSCWIAPECSANAMNSSGPIGPSSGCRQRSSTSTCSTAPRARQIFGWKRSDISPRAIAWRRSPVRRRRRRCCSSCPSRYTDAPPPCCRACWRAMSARRNRVSASAPCAGISAMPMLASARIRACGRLSGCLSCASSSSA